MTSSHAFGEHTAEVELRVRASSLGELLAEAGRGLARLLLRDTPLAPFTPWCHIEVSSTDRAALLVDWLNELIYRAEADFWIAVEFEISHAAETQLVARARGVPVERSPGYVKAATFHGLRIEEVDGGLEARVILDV